MEWWQTTLIAGAVSLIVGTVPGVIFFVLNRKGANKKLDIEEGGLNVNQFDVQTKAYQDLLNRANKATEEALAELATYKKERTRLMEQVEEQGRKIRKLEKADEDKTGELEDARRKVEQLRSLFTAILTRTGIVMTPEEQEIFEATQPKWLITKEVENNT